MALTEAKAKAEVRRMEQAAENLVLQEQARVTNEIEIDKNRTQMQILHDKEIKEAEAKAMAIRAITEAEYLQKGPSLYQILVFHHFIIITTAVF